MKGAGAGFEFLGKILITVFIIGIIVILLVTFLPEFSDQACKNKQFESINGILNDAIGARATKTIKTFVVQSCVEYVEFNIDCKEPVRFSQQGNPRNCYEVLGIGQNSGNCGGVDVNCDVHKGTLNLIPGNRGVIQISGYTDPDPLRLKSGTYSVEIGPYSINFIKPKELSEKNG